VHECSITKGGVETAECVAVERVKSNGGVAAAGCQAEKGILPLCGIAIRIATIRWRIDSKDRCGEDENGKDKRVRFHGLIISDWRQLGQK
jgi:hypothetical protein